MKKKITTFTLQQADSTANIEALTTNSNIFIDQIN